MIKKEELNRLKKVCEKATPAPWTSTGKLGIEHDRDIVAVVNLARASQEDANFIAESRQTMPRLIQEVEQLQFILNKIANNFDSACICPFDTATKDSIENHADQCPWAIANGGIK